MARIFIFFFFAYWLNFEYKGELHFEAFFSRHTEKIEKAVAL